MHLAIFWLSKRRSCKVCRIIQPLMICGSKFGCVTPWGSCVHMRPIGYATLFLRCRQEMRVRCSQQSNMISFAYCHYECACLLQLQWLQWHWLWMCWRACCKHVVLADMFEFRIQNPDWLKRHAHLHMVHTMLSTQVHATLFSVSRRSIVGCSVQCNRLSLLS